MNAAATHGYQSNASNAVLGLVKSTYPRNPVNQAAVNDAHFSISADLDAWARRAALANGFGDAGATTEPVSLLDAGAPDAAAHGHRSASLVAIMGTIGTALADAIRSAAQRWREQREIRRTYLALSGLDERTLKDIAIGGQEFGSIAHELAGLAERTRIHALRTLRELSY